MALYKCKIIDLNGDKKVVHKESFNEVTLRAEFRREKRVLLKYTLVAQRAANPFLMFSSRLDEREILLFYRQFAIILRAGGTVSEALRFLQRAAFSKYFKNIILQIYLDVQAGESLSQALAKHSSIFPEFFVGMVAVGEVSGTLEKIMDDMADYYEHEKAIKRKAASSAAYPLALAIMIVFTVAAMMLFVLPRFKDFISAVGGELPPATQALITASYFINENIIYIIVALAACVIGLIAFSHTESGRYIFDSAKIKLPVFGRVTVAGITARFCKAFLILLSSGMTAIDAMDNLLKTFDNAVFKKRFRYSIVEVRRGKSIATSIEAIGLFPPSFIEMLRIGERSGNLEGALKAASKSCDDDVTFAAARAVNMLEPALILILGGVVAFVALSVVTPILSLANTSF